MNLKKQSAHKIVYASGPAIIEAPAHVAFYNNYFEQREINLDFKIYPDGKTSLSKLFAGEVDLAGVMATPVVKESFNRKDFRIIAVVEHPKFHHLLVNKKIISAPADLKGKNVGVTKGTSGEYLMYSYLIQNEINPDEIELLDLPGPDLVQAMEQGKIDAVFSWNPYIREIKNNMDNVTELESSQLVPPSWVIVCMKQFIAENPPVVENFLKGLKKGVEFLNTNPDKAIAIHLEIGGLESSGINSKDIENEFALTLQQQLLLDLEKQARWILSQKDTINLELPNYLDFIYPDAMAKISPDAVTLIK